MQRYRVLSYSTGFRIRHRSSTTSSMLRRLSGCLLLKKLSAASYYSNENSRVFLPKHISVSASSPLAPSIILQSSSSYSCQQSLSCSIYCSNFLFFFFDLSRLEDFFLWLFADFFNYFFFIRDLSSMLKSCRVFDFILETYSFDFFI